MALAVTDRYGALHKWEDLKRLIQSFHQENVETFSDQRKLDEMQVFVDQ